MGHSDSYLVDWNREQYETLEKGVLLAKHRLHETGLFSDDNLARIIDTHPAECLHVNTMGTDTNKFQWREGDRSGIHGDVLLEKNFTFPITFQVDPDAPLGFRDLVPNADELVKAPFEETLAV